MSKKTDKMGYGELCGLADRMLDRDATCFIAISFVCMALVLVAWSLWGFIPEESTPALSVLRAMVGALGLSAGLFAWDLTREKSRETLSALNVMAQTCVFGLCLSGMVRTIYTLS